MSCQIACGTLFSNCISLLHGFATLKNAYSEIGWSFLVFFFCESSSSFLKDETGEVYNLFESVPENFYSVCSDVL